MDRDAPAEWRGKFLQYKALKKALKELKTSEEAPCDAGADAAAGADAEGAPAAAAAAAADAEARFFELLHSELHRINR